MHPEETHSPTRYRLVTAAQRIVHQHSSPERQRRQREQGFTLIEMIIVLAVIGILAAIAIPQFSGILGGAQATVMAGELASASASNVATCRQRGLEHPACVSTSEFATESIRLTFIDDGNRYKESNATPSGVLSALYAIHISGADTSGSGSDSIYDDPEDHYPDWIDIDSPISGNPRLVDDLAIACDHNVDTQWANMQCAIIDFTDGDVGSSGLDAAYENTDWPWDDDTNSTEVVETFQMTWIEAE